MTRTRKNLNINFVKFFSKIGQTLFADLAYVTVHHLRSIYRNLRAIYQKSEKCQFSEYLRKSLISLLNQ